MVQKLVKESKYVNFFYEEDKEIITAVWLPTTARLYLENEYKEVCLLTVQICEKYKPKYWLVDNRTLLYMITPDIQEWIDQELTPRFLKAGLQKMAVLHNEDFEKPSFENVAMEQLMEEENTKDAWKTQFFTNEEKAYRWFLT